MNSSFRFQLKNEARATFYNLYRLFFHGSRSYQFIFILSHMRSGSSLLTKIVSDNPEVNGYGETYLPYLTPRDYGSSIGKILFVNKRSKKNGHGPYILDKLLFDYLLPLENIDLLLAKKVRVIFLIREPEESIASMINIMKMTAENSYKYYMDRLDMLERYCKIITTNSPAVLVTYKQILYQTGAVFKLLEDYLNLSVPLQETYKLTTRSDYAGDPSSNLASGRILRDTPKQEYKQFPKEWLERAQSRYIHCYQTLSQRCISIEEDAPFELFLKSENERKNTL